MWGAALFFNVLSVFCVFVTLCVGLAVATLIVTAPFSALHAAIFDRGKTPPRDHRPASWYALVGASPLLALFIEAVREGSEHRGTADRDPNSGPSAPGS